MIQTDTDDKRRMKTRGIIQTLPRDGEVRIPSNASPGEAKTFMMMSVYEIVGVDGACSSIGASDVVGCEPVHDKVKTKVVFSNSLAGKGAR
jgi:hypothetical protein